MYPLSFSDQLMALPLKKYSIIIGVATQFSLSILAHQSGVYLYYTVGTLVFDGITQQ